MKRLVVVRRGGKIEAVGANVAVPPGAQVVDASGRLVSPGIIDAHPLVRFARQRESQYVSFTASDRLRTRTSRGPGTSVSHPLS